MPATSKSIEEAKTRLLTESRKWKEAFAKIQSIRKVDAPTVVSLTDTILAALDEVTAAQIHLANCVTDVYSKILATEKRADTSITLSTQTIADVAECKKTLTEGNQNLKNLEKDLRTNKKRRD